MDFDKFFKTEEWKVVEEKWSQAYDQLSRIGDCKTIKELEGKRWAQKVLSDFMEYLRGEIEWEIEQNKKIKSYIVTKTS